VPLTDRPPRNPLSLWNGATWLVGVPVLIELVQLLATISGGWFTLDIHGTLLVLALVGFLFSIPDGLAYVRGDEPHRTPSRRRWDVEQLPRGDPGPSYVIIETRSSYRGLKPRELSPLWYVLYVVFVQAPREVGDVLLEAFWRTLGRTGDGRRRAGRRGEPEEGRATGDPDLPPPSEF
jgi:hypothetical protein